VCAMATNITLKKIPDDLHKELKASAVRHRRSLNSEILALLESGLKPRRRNVDEILERVRALRERMKGAWLDDDMIDRAKREGRE